MKPSGRRYSFFLTWPTRLNVDGKRNALTEIKGVGRRYSNLVCKEKRMWISTSASGPETSTLTSSSALWRSSKTPHSPRSLHFRRQELAILSNGVHSNLRDSDGLDSKLRGDLERLKNIHTYRGLRHYWGPRVRGPRTKTTDRRGKTVGVAKQRE
ncbi:ribosomal protein S13p/S18e [Mycena rebaudengoi]|nr:ribosomal protein S13p/S18e [Mycena rebaudengoi]